MWVFEVCNIFCAILNEILHSLAVNINSPSSVKSPAKDFGINERILLGKDKVITGFDRWQLAQSNGEQCINIINNLKIKARLSGGTPYPAELEPYCKKLEVIRSVFEDVIKSVAGFQKEIAGSVSILETMLEDEELKERLTTVQKFLDVLIALFQSSLQVKQFIVGKFFMTFSTVFIQIIFQQRTSLMQPHRMTLPSSLLRGAATRTWNKSSSSSLSWKSPHQTTNGSSASSSKASEIIVKNPLFT